MGSKEILVIRTAALWTWALLGPLLAFLLLPFLGPSGFSHWRWRNGVLWVPVERLLPKWAGAQCWGGVVLTRRETPPLLTLFHEDRHSTQWALLGPLFPVAYAVAWMVAGFSYRDNWFERDARIYSTLA